MYPIYAYGSQEQKDRWIPKLATGEAIGCFGLTEPDFGSNPGGMRTHAQARTATRWVLNGAKPWITNGSVADVAVVWAKSRRRRSAASSSRRARPGFTTARPHGKFSLRASVTSRAVFEDCRIPADEHAARRRTASRTRWLPQPGALRHRLGRASARRWPCYDTALEYAKERIQFGGQPIASHQLVQEKLAWMITEITKGQLLALQLGRLKDAGQAQAAARLDGQDEQRLASPSSAPARPRHPRRQRHRRTSTRSSATC